MTSQVGTVLQALAKAEHCRPALHPALVTTISITDSAVSCSTPSGAEMTFSLSSVDDDVMTALNNLYPHLHLSQLPAPTVWPAVPWAPEQGWGNYLYDLGSYEHLLDDFSPRVIIQRIALTPNDIEVEVGDGRFSMTRKLPLDGTGFTGALPVELAADFLAAGN